MFKPVLLSRSWRISGYFCSEQKFRWKYQKYYDKNIFLIYVAGRVKEEVGVLWEIEEGNEKTTKYRGFWELVISKWTGE